MGAKNNCKTAAVMGLIGRGPAPEAAPPVPVERPRDIETITGEILDAKRAGGEAVLTIGKRLIEAKAMLSHGDWLLWLETRVEFSERTAQNFMRLARHYSNPQTLADLGSSKALMLLAVPEEEREEFVSVPHEVDGHEKTVADMSARELAQAIKERDEALKAAAQAQADQTAAEQARAKMAEDMALSNERVEGLNAELRDRQKTLDLLTAELKKLRERPVEVAVESDPAAIEAARKEAEAAMRDKLDEAEAASEQAHAAAEQALRELKQAQTELDALRAKTAQAEKKASLASNEDLLLFRTLFDQTQELSNKMSGVLLKVRNKDPEKAAGLSKALMALSEKIRGVAAQ